MNVLAVILEKFGITFTTRFGWTGYNKMNQRYAYFTDEEVIGLNEEFCAKLDMARKVAGIPFQITSGLRTLASNQSVIGAVPDSAHLRGLAVDLRVENSHEVWKIIDGLTSAGINRIGIYVNKDWAPTHIHCDVDPNKIQEVIFIKQEAN